MLCQDTKNGVGWAGEGGSRLHLNLTLRVINC